MRLLPSHRPQSQQPYIPHLLGMMGRIEPQFHGVLASIAVAYLLISPTALALPPQEWKPDEQLFEPLDLPPDILTKAPLMGRAFGERGSARARYLRQIEAAAIFEASRLAASVQRERKAQENWLEDRELNREPGSQLSSPDHLVSSSAEHRHSQTAQTGNGISALNDPDVVAKSTPILVDAASERHVYPRGHHHSHHPDDHSRGGHSDHWFEHHALKPASYHRSHHGHHHHHVRQSGKGPSRLVQVRSSAVHDDPVTLVAPSSAQPVIEDLPEFEDSDSITLSKTPSRMLKERTRRGEEERNVDSSDRPLEAREPKLHEDDAPKADDQSRNGIPGVIDLMQGSPDGEKLGGLSISPLPPNGTVPSFGVLAFLIDSTPNLIDQASFFLHTFKDQSTLDHETPPSGAPRDLLVALEVPHASDKSLTQRMCATFDPLEMDSQVFGLALCMDQDSATNNRRMSQAFRYSPGAGILTPFYGAEGARESVLAAVNQRIQAMDLGEDEQNGWNGTGIYDLDPNFPTLTPDWMNPTTSSLGYDLAASFEDLNSTHTPFPGSGASSISRTSSGVPETNNMNAAAPTPTPLLSVNDTSMVDHPFIIGGPTAETASTTSEGTSLSVVMVFHSNMESDLWRRTKQDVDTPEERQKALENYRGIGLASKDATRLDHWAVIDKIQSNSLTKPSPKAISSETHGNATRLVANFDSQDGDTADSSEDDDTPLPKPVLNVAYFGDSGRSAPVPPDQQADFARPILVADPLAKPHAASKLVATHPNEPEESGQDRTTAPPTSLMHHGQTAQNPAPGVMAAVSKSRTGPLGIPIDASD